MPALGNETAPQAAAEPVDTDTWQETEEAIELRLRGAEEAFEERLHSAEAALGGLVSNMSLPSFDTTAAVASARSAFADPPPELTAAIAFFVIMVLLCLGSWIESLLSRFRNGPSQKELEEAMDQRRRQARLLAAAYPRSDDVEFAGARAAAVR